MALNRSYPAKRGVSSLLNLTSVPNLGFDGAARLKRYWLSCELHPDGWELVLGERPLDVFGQ